MTKETLKFTISGCRDSDDAFRRAHYFCTEYFGSREYEILEAEGEPLMLHPVGGLQYVDSWTVTFVAEGSK